MSISFAAPSTGGGGTGVSASDLVGHVVVVEPQEHVLQMETKYGTKDAIRCRVHDINGQVTYDDCLWFNAFVIGSLKDRVGQKVLALVYSEQTDKGNDAVKLRDVSGESAAVEAATAYLNAMTAATLTAPAAAAPVAAAPSALDAALGNLAAAGLTK